MPFDKEEEEVKCNDIGTLFVTCAEEEKARSIQEAIYTLMKRHGAEMRDSAEASAKGARVVFPEAVNAAVEAAVSKVRGELELHRRRDANEAASVDKDNGCRRRSQDEE